jgi:hypothetical protein
MVVKYRADVLHAVSINGTVVAFITIYDSTVASNAVSQPSPWLRLSVPC